MTPQDRAYIEGFISEINRHGLTKSAQSITGYTDPAFLQAGTQFGAEHPTAAKGAALASGGILAGVTAPIWAPVAAGAAPVVGAAGTAISRFGKPVINAAKTYGPAAWNATRGYAGQAVNAAKTYGPVAWNATKSYAGQAANAAKTYGPAAWNATKSYAGQAANAVRPYVGKAVNAATKYGPKVWNTGKTLVGMNNNFGKWSLVTGGLTAGLGSIGGLLGWTDPYGDTETELQTANGPTFSEEQRWNEWDDDGSYDELSNFSTNSVDIGRNNGYTR